MSGKKKYHGVTLLEVMLVLAIGASITVLSLRMYRTYVNDQYLGQIQLTVDSIFTAMGIYFKANCNDQKDSTGTVIRAGALSPSTITYPTTDSVNVNIETQLSGTASGNFLQTTLIPNPIVDETVGADGYFAQFNPINTGTGNTPGTIGQYTCWNYGASSTTTYDTGPYLSSTVVCSDQSLPQSSPNVKPIPLSEVLIWRIQVSVKIKDQYSATTYKNLLGADCTSSESNGVIAPCSAKSPGQYVVWERMPSLASPRTSSGYWELSPMQADFNRQYTHDPMYEMMYPTYNTSWTSQPFYVCGG